MTYIELFGRVGIDMASNEHKKAVDIANSNIKAFAQNNDVNVSDEQLNYILSSVEDACVDYEDESRRLNEFARLFLILHQGSLKINGVECNSLNDELRGVLLEYLLKKFEEENKDCIFLFDWYDDLSMEDIISGIRNNETDVLDNLLKDSELDINLSLRQAKSSKRSLVRRMCEILHPDYLEGLKTLPKNEVCFVYDVLVFAGLQKDNGLTSNDDKYDRIKHFVRKEEYVYTGEDEDELDKEELDDMAREELRMVIGRKYYRFKR